jgi:hypothetical protein
MIATNYFVAVFLHGQDFPVEVLDVEIDLYQPKPLWAAVDVATQAHPDWRELRIYDVPPLYWEKPGEAAPPVADVAVITRRAEEFRDGQSLEGTALVIRYSSDLQYEERFRLAMGEQRNSAFAKAMRTQVRRSYRANLLWWGALSLAASLLVMMASARGFPLFSPEPSAQTVAFFSGVLLVIVLLAFGEKKFADLLGAATDWTMTYQLAMADAIFATLSANGRAFTEEEALRFDSDGCFIERPVHIPLLPDEASQFTVLIRAGVPFEMATGTRCRVLIEVPLTPMASDIHGDG